MTDTTIQEQTDKIYSLEADIWFTAQDKDISIKKLDLVQTCIGIIGQEDTNKTYPFFNKPELEARNRLRIEQLQTLLQLLTALTYT